MLLSNSKLSINLETVYSDSVWVLSSAKLCIEAITIKKNKSLSERLNKTGSSKILVAR